MTSSACWSVVGTEHRKFKNLMILRSVDSVFPVLSPCLWAYPFLFSNWLLYWSRLAKIKWPLKKRFKQFLLGLVCDFICIWVLTKKAGLSLWFVKGYLGPSTVQSGLWQHPILHLIHCTFPSWWVGLSIPVLPMQKLKFQTHVEQEFELGSIWLKPLQLLLIIFFHSIFCFRGLCSLCPWSDLWVHP